MENDLKLNYYPGHMAKTKRLIKENIALIDIVFELVDSRIPFSSKINGLDDLIRNKPKILIMTKYDLCDINETNKWINYYENKGYSVITLNLKNNLDYKKLISLVEKVTSNINEKRQSKDLLKKEIKALVFGIPNVGKSTLINALAGKKSQKVENKPGVTKELVWIKTKHDLRILDTPGLLWPKLDNIIGLNLAAMTAIKTDFLPINEISYHILITLTKYYPLILKNLYDVLGKETIEEIYAKIALKIGAIKNQEIDYERVSMLIINDIKKERIKGITFDRR